MVVADILKRTVLKGYMTAAAAIRVLYICGYQWHNNIYAPLINFLVKYIKIWYNIINGIAILIESGGSAEVT